MTPLPVVGVPVPLQHLDGMDSLLSIVQMPAGVPVATVSIGGARNAGLLAVRVLAAGDGPEAGRLREEMLRFQDGLREVARRQGRSPAAQAVRGRVGPYPPAWAACSSAMVRMLSVEESRSAWNTCSAVAWSQSTTTPCSVRRVVSATGTVSEIPSPPALSRMASRNHAEVGDAVLLVHGQGVAAGPRERERVERVEHRGRSEALLRDGRHHLALPLDPPEVASRVELAAAGVPEGDLAVGLLAAGRDVEVVGERVLHRHLGADA